MSLADRIRSDASKFTNSRDFAETVSLTISGSTRSISCLFYEEYSESGQWNMASANTAPAALCRTADVEGVGNGDQIERGGTTYYVLNAKPDQLGHRLLILSKDPPHG